MRSIPPSPTSSRLVSVTRGSTRYPANCPAPCPAGQIIMPTGVYGQAINFADVPAELLGSVEVYKNSKADLIEGGLSGTVNAPSE